MTTGLRISAGRLTALWLVLRSLQRLGGRVSEAELLSFAGRSGLRSGGLPIRDGLALAQVGGFVETAANVTLTDAGTAVLGTGGEDEPSQQALRMFISA